jgi:hypothetical protein
MCVPMEAQLRYLRCSVALGGVQGFRLRPFLLAKRGLCAVGCSHITAACAASLPEVLQPPQHLSI